MAKTTAIAMLITIAMLSNSCIDNTIQHQHKHISNNTWFRNDTLTYELPAAKLEGVYSIDTELRMPAPCQYKRICIIREISLQSPLAYRKDTICIDTEENGLFSGRKGTALRCYSHRDSTLLLNEGQKGCLKLYHAMSHEALKQIKDIGIRIRSID